MLLKKILESPLYNKKIKPVNLKGNQPLIPAVSAEASTEGLQVERTDAFTAKVPNHGSSKQRVCSSTPGGSSERLKALCILGPPVHVLHSPQQHWRPRKGHSGPWRRGMAQGSTGASITKYDWKEQSRKVGQRAGEWSVARRGNQLCMNYHTKTPLEEKPSDKII